MTIDASGCICLLGINEREPAALEAENTQLKREVEMLSAQVKLLMEQLHMMRQQKYGRSSEKGSLALVEGQVCLFNEAEQRNPHKLGYQANSPSLTSIFIEAVNDWREVYLARRDAELCDVRQPFGVGGVCTKVPIQKVLYLRADLANV